MRNIHRGRTGNAEKRLGVSVWIGACEVRVVAIAARRRICAEMQSVEKNVTSISFVAGNKARTSSGGAVQTLAAQRRLRSSDRRCSRRQRELF